MTNEEIIAHHKREAAFFDTPIGKAFMRHRRALIAYWQEDKSETVSDRRLRKLSDAADEAEREFQEMLMHLSGMSP